MMKINNNNKGITLISIVITVILLIILAGISINAILGENGIITIAKQAKENVELAQMEEQTKLNELYTQIKENDSNINSGLNPDDIILTKEEYNEIIERISILENDNKTSKEQLKILSNDIDIIDTYSEEVISSDYAYDNVIHAYNYRGIKKLNINGLKNITTIGKSFLICTLPQEYCPKEICAFDRINVHNETYRLMITTNGDVFIYFYNTCNYLSNTSIIEFYY